jgi:hypothetical protein
VQDPDDPGARLPAGRQPERHRHAPVPDGPATTGRPRSAGARTARSRP